jgi:hypothetical protein
MQQQHSYPESALTIRDQIHLPSIQSLLGERNQIFTKLHERMSLIGIVLVHREGQASHEITRLRSEYLFLSKLVESMATSDPMRRNILSYFPSAPGEDSEPEIEGEEEEEEPMPETPVSTPPSLHVISNPTTSVSSPKRKRPRTQEAWRLRTMREYNPPPPPPPPFQNAVTPLTSRVVSEPPPPFNFARVDLRSTVHSLPPPDTSFEGDDGFDSSLITTDDESNNKETVKAALKKEEEEEAAEKKTIFCNVCMEDRHPDDVAPCLNECTFRYCFLCYMAARKEHGAGPANYRPYNCCPQCNNPVSPTYTMRFLAHQCKERAEKHAKKRMEAHNRRVEEDRVRERMLVHVAVAAQRRNPTFGCTSTIGK